MLLLSLLQLGNSGNHFLNLIGTQHKINMGSPLNQLLPFFLCHTASDTQNKVRILPLEILNLTDFSIDLVLSIFTHCTGIYHNKVSLLHILYGLIAQLGQLTLHTLCVTEVHLTAVCQHL